MDGVAALTEDKLRKTVSLGLIYYPVAKSIWAKLYVCQANSRAAFNLISEL